MIDFPYEFIREDLIICSWIDDSEKIDDYLNSLISQKISEIQMKIEKNQFCFYIGMVKFQILDIGDELGSWSLRIKKDDYGIGNNNLWIYIEDGQLISEYKI